MGPTLRGDRLPLPPRTRRQPAGAGTELGEGAGREPSVAEQVLDVVASIPSGRVLTYGDIAGRLGLGSARQVGHVLSGDLLADEAGSVPWHRVVRADGTLAEHIATEQSRRLRAEGVTVTGGRLRLADHRWSEG